MRSPFNRELIHQTTCPLFFRHSALNLPVEQFEQNSHYLLVVPTYGARLELGVNFQANFLSNLTLRYSYLYLHSNHVPVVNPLVPILCPPCFDTFQSINVQLCVTEHPILRSIVIISDALT